MEEVQPSGQTLQAYTSAHTCTHIFSVYLNFLVFNDWKNWTFRTLFYLRGNINVARSQTNTPKCDLINRLHQFDTKAEMLRVHSKETSAVGTILID